MGDVFVMATALVHWADRLHAGTVIKLWMSMSISHR
jgi:hypothetical protein